MDKQKKIVLQVVIPVSIIVFVLIFFLIKNFVFKKEVEPTHRITTEIPDVNQKIEESKVKAYDNQKLYQHAENNVVESDFLLEKPKEKKEQVQLPKENLCTSAKENKGKERFKDKMKRASHETEQEYEDLIEGKKKTGSPSKIESKINDSIQTLVFPQPLVFNSQTKKLSNNDSECEIVGFIHNEQTVINRSLVKLRTGNEFMYQGVRIPNNTILYGTTLFQNNRLQISIRSLPSGKRSIPCSITIYDLDGLPGLNINENSSIESGKKVASTSSRKIGSTLGSALKVMTGTGVAGEIAGVAAEGVTKAVADGVSDHVKLNKVTLTNNYRIILKLN